MDAITTLPDDSTPREGSAVARLSHRHEQIINWLLENPHRSLRECADEMGYSQGWLSQLIHSDIFQAQLRNRQEAVFVAVAQDIPTKLKGLADVTIEKVTQLVSESENPDLLVDVFDKTLNRLGYAPQKAAAAPAGPAPQVNVFNISREELAAARQSIGAPPAPTLELTIDQNSNAGALGFPVAAPAALPSGD